MFETVVFVAVGGLYMVLCLVVMIALARAARQADRRRRPMDVMVLRWEEDEDPRHWNRG